MKSKDGWDDDADEHADFQPMDDESLIVNELDSLTQDNPGGTTATVLNAKRKVRADAGSLLAIVHGKELVRCASSSSSGFIAFKEALFSGRKGKKSSFLGKHFIYNSDESAGLHFPAASI